MNDQNRAGNGRQGRQKAKTGNFRFAQAHLRGVIVRDGPVTRHAQSGAEWVECTLLVGIYDGRQKLEREPPLFVRVRAFGDRAGLLDDYQRGDHVSVAGALVLRVWEDNNGNLREEYQLYADAVSRQAYPQMRELLQAEAPAAEPAGGDGWDEPGAGEPAATDGWNETNTGAEPGDLTEDDIPF